MGPTGNKAKRISLLNHATRPNHHHHHYHRQVKSVVCCLVLGSCSQFLGGFRWYHVVSAGFRSSQAIPRFSQYGTSLCWLRFDVFIFVQKLTLYQLLCKTLIILILNLQKLLNEDCTFTGVYRVIYMAPSHRFYIQFVQKFQTSEMLDKLSLIFKVSNNKLSRYPDSQYILFTCTRIHLLVIPMKLFFLFFKFFASFITIEFLVLDNRSTLPI